MRSTNKFDVSVSVERAAAAIQRNIYSSRCAMRSHSIVAEKVKMLESMVFAVRVIRSTMQLKQTVPCIHMARTTMDSIKL